MFCNKVLDFEIGQFIHLHSDDPCHFPQSIFVIDAQSEVLIDMGQPEIIIAVASQLLKVKEFRRFVLFEALHFARTAPCAIANCDHPAVYERSVPLTVVLLYGIEEHIEIKSLKE